MVKMGLWTPQTPQTLSHILFHAEILRDLSMKQDVRESLWCL